MRRFTVKAVGCTGEDLFLWEDVGFEQAQKYDEANRGLYPDVALIRLKQGQQSEWQIVESLFPKLYVVLSSSELPPPAGLREIYEPQFIAAKDFCFSIGSRLPGRVAVPDWEAHTHNGILTADNQVKAVAGSVYRFLLEDVFRETAEWCGHMSSVVGPV